MKITGTATNHIRYDVCRKCSEIDIQKLTKEVKNETDDFFKIKCQRGANGDNFPTTALKDLAHVTADTIINTTKNTTKTRRMEALAPPFLLRILYLFSR